MGHGKGGHLHASFIIREIVLLFLSLFILEI